MSTTVTRQWYRDDTPIPGATGLTYRLTAADVGAVMTCRETATNRTGTTTASSNALGPVTPIPRPGFGALRWVATTP